MALRLVKSVDVSKEVLDGFSLLAKDEVDVKVHSSLDILQYLEREVLKVQSNENLLPAGDCADEKEEQVLNDNIKYVIKRLVCGMASDRQTVRHGLYITLQASLQLCPVVSSYVYSVLKNEYTNHNCIGKDTGNYFIGEILVYGALVRSNALGPDIHEEVIDRLLYLRDKKSYIDILATQFIVNLMTMNNAQCVQNTVWSRLKDKLAYAVEEMPSCLLWIRIVLASSAYTPFMVPRPPPFLSSTLDAENYVAIGKTIMQSESDSKQIHPLVSTLLEALKKKGEKYLVEFWNIGIAPHMKESSSKRLTFIFNFAQMVLQSLNKAENIKIVLSPSLFDHILRSVTRNDQSLDSSARGLAALIIQLFVMDKESGSIQIAILNSLLSVPGGIRFDWITGTKLQQQTYEHMSLSAIKFYADLLKDGIAGRTEKVEGVSLSQRDKVFATHWLSRMIWHSAVLGGEYQEWREILAGTLMHFAYFDKPKVVTSSKAVTDAFHKCLIHPSRKLHELASLLRYIIQKANSTLDQEKYAGILSTEAMQHWLNIMKVLNNICCSNKNEDKLINVVFSVLYGHMALQLLEDSKDVIDILLELDSCYERASNLKSDEHDDFTWVEVVVDVLVYFLSKTDSFWRNVSQSILKMLCHMMTSRSLYVITDVLDPSKQKSLVSSGSGIIENYDNIDEDDDDSDDEEDEDGNDFEIVDDENKESDEDAPNNKLLELKSKMNLLVGIGDDIELDEADPEEMKVMDYQLGGLFSQYIQLRRPKKSKKLLMNEVALMHFRSRVCDLLDVITKESPSVELALGMVCPLLKSLQLLSSLKLQEPLCNRLLNSLTLLCQSRKYEKVGNITLKDVCKLFDSVLYLGSQLLERYSNIVNKCATFVFRCGLELVTQKELGQDNELIDLLLVHLEEFYRTKNCSLSFKAFVGILNLGSPCLWSLYSFLVAQAFDENIRLFLRTKALNMLNTLYCNHAIMNKVSPEVLRNYEEELSDKIIKLLKNLEESQSIKDIYLSNVFSLIRTVVKKRSYCEVCVHLLPVLETFSKKVLLKRFPNARSSLSSLIGLLKFQSAGSATHMAVPVNASKQSEQVMKKKKPAFESDQSHHKNMKRSQSSYVFLDNTISPISRKKKKQSYEKYITL